MREKLERQVSELTGAVTADTRWDVEDEVLVQVFGFIAYGFAFGVGRLLCFADESDIDEVAVSQLTSLGVGDKYANGLIELARDAFRAEEAGSVHRRLTEIGHSHFGSEDLTELKEAVFGNTEALKAAGA